MPEPPALLDASGRTLFLAGAAGGIGRAVAELFAAAGAFLCSDHAASTTGASANISGGLVLD